MFQDLQDVRFILISLEKSCASCLDSITSISCGRRMCLAKEIAGCRSWCLHCFENCFNHTLNITMTGQKESALLL